MKKIIRKLANKFGYDIIKTGNNYHGDPNKEYDVQVANFTLLMPGNNPLVRHYKQFPDYNIKLGVLAQLVQKKYSDSYVLDVGANTGDTIAVIKSAIEVPIIGIEGDEFTFSYLQKNANKFKNLHILNQFLGSESKTQLSETLKEGWNTTIIPTTDSSKNKSKLLQLKSLDDLLSENNLIDKTIKLLKIDAEGYDTIILRGASKLLSHLKPVLFFEYNRENMDVIKEDGLSTLFSLSKYGYERICFMDNHNRPILDTTLSEKEIIEQLHFYADGEKGLIPHYDICIFSSTDSDILNSFLNTTK